MTPRKRKHSPDAVHRIQRSDLDAALQLIEDAKKSKKTSKSKDRNYSAAIAAKCKNTRFSDMRWLSESEQLIREMRAAFCRWDWNSVLELLVYAVQVRDRPLLEYAQACFPVLVTQHPELKSQGRSLIEEALFAAGIADPTEQADKLLALNDDEEDQQFVEEMISKLFSPRLARRRSVKKRRSRHEDKVSTDDSSSDEEKWWRMMEEEEKREEEWDEEEEWIDEREDEGSEENGGEEEEDKREDDGSEVDEGEGNGGEEEEDEESKVEGEGIEETGKEDGRSEVDEDENDKEIEEEDSVKNTRNRLKSDSIECVRVLNQEDYLLGNDRSDEKDDFGEDCVCEGSIILKK